MGIILTKQSNSETNQMNSYTKVLISTAAGLLATQVEA